MIGTHGPIPNALPVTLEGPTNAKPPASCKKLLPLPLAASP